MCELKQKKIKKLKMEKKFTFRVNLSFINFLLISLLKFGC